MLEESSATSVAVAFEDESLALSTALLVHQTLRSPDVPIVVRTNADTGLGSLVTPEDSARPPFPGLARKVVSITWVRWRRPAPKPWRRVRGTRLSLAPVGPGYG